MEIQQQKYFKVSESKLSLQMWKKVGTWNYQDRLKTKTFTVKLSNVIVNDEFFVEYIRYFNLKLGEKSFRIFSKFIKSFATFFNQTKKKSEKNIANPSVLKL